MRRSVRTMRETESAGAVDELLLRRMEPAAYAVVASLSPSRATRRRSPPTTRQRSARRSCSSTTSASFRPRRARAVDVLLGAIRGDIARDARPEVTPATMVADEALDTAALEELEDALATLHPAYLAFVSNRMTLPVELVGEPPLATRYAVGRLTAPDIPTLAMLISAAALREEVVRDARASAVIVDAADALENRDIPEVTVEVRNGQRAAGREGRLQRHQITGADDRDRFVTVAREGGNHPLLRSRALLRHRARRHRARSSSGPGCGHRTSRRSARSPDRLQQCMRVRSFAPGRGPSRAWNGLAAGFIHAGALNYLGSLWPILDEGSRKLAERFYALLVDGHSVGESLRRAKLQAFNERDATWAAVVLFGCPRNRLRSSDAELA